MKKTLLLIVTLIFTVLILSACGSEKHEPTIVVETPAPVTETAKPEPSMEVLPEVDIPEESAQPEYTGLDNEKYQAALGLIGENVEELYKAIGNPEYQDYGPSCLGDYDSDGQLDYEGFSVFTVVKGEVETVYDVLRDDEF